MELQKQLKQLTEAWLKFWQTLYTIDKVRGVIGKHKLLNIEFWSDGMRLFFGSPWYALYKDVYESKAEAKEVLKDIFLEKIRNIK